MLFSVSVVEQLSVLLCCKTTKVFHNKIMKQLEMSRKRSLLVTATNALNHHQSCGKEETKVVPYHALLLNLIA